MIDHPSAQRPLVSRTDLTREERAAIRVALMTGLGGLAVLALVMWAVVLAGYAPGSANPIAVFGS